MLITLGSLVLEYSFDYMSMCLETIHISGKQWGAYTYVEGHALFFLVEKIELLLYFPFSLVSLTILADHVSNQLIIAHNTLNDDWCLSWLL
jgi:hypothetical protein